MPCTIEILIWEVRLQEAVKTPKLYSTKHSYYGSNTKRKKSRFIPKIFNQEHLFESLSLRNNSPNKLPQTKWFQGFKLYHRKTGRESIMQRSFDSSNSVCLQPVGNAIHSSYRCRTITAVAPNNMKITTKTNLNIQFQINGQSAYPNTQHGP